MLDESSFSLLPTPCQAWAAPRQTPLLYHCFSWPKLSAISAVTPDPRAGLRPVRGTVTSRYLITFVRDLLRRTPDSIFPLWDGINTRRSKKGHAALAERRSFSDRCLLSF